MSAKGLSYKPLDSLGINGLDTQHNPSVLSPEWLTKADNIVLRESGRISFRKGFKQAVLANPNGGVGSVVEHKDGTVNKVFAAVDDDIYEVAFGSPDTPWTNAFATGATNSDWDFTNFNGKLVGVQAGEDAVRYDSGTWTLLKNAAGYHAPAGVTTFDPSCSMGYYGRLWVGGVTEETDVLYYSDTLLETKWSSGAAGVLDLKTVWGTDDIVAISTFAGNLVIFGRRNIVLYTGAEDPDTMQLVEVIRGIGCVSRDTVQSVGDDLYFLSDTGVRSLARTTEKANLPLTDYSLTIKDTLVRHISQSNPDTAKAIYIESEGIYLLAFTDNDLMYVFDIKHKTPVGTPRITTWSTSNNRNPLNFAYTASQGFLIGQKSGSLAKYEGYFDKDYSGSQVWTNHSYTGTFSTVWIDLGDSVRASLLKKMKAVISGGKGTFVGVKWYKDFSSEPSKSQSFGLAPASSGTPYLWGNSASLYGAATYAPTYGLKEYSIPMGGSAKHLQIVMTAETNGFVAALQDMTLLHKQGKIR